MSMFEITGEDIALLNDEQLRTLVGRLCEAELRKRGLSPAYVTWGGNQNAADGGIDVRVSLPTGSNTDGFIPRGATGFQAKKEDMPRQAIINEMCPKGELRQSIQSLINEGGAYIIVSSVGSTADFALDNRRKAMAEAVAGYPNAGALALDFYDRNRIATWVRTHEGLILWVRQTIGKPIDGWQSYGPWAAPVADAYLADAQSRIYPGRKRSESGLSAIEGIQALRDHLREPRRAVRLVGLSGVGKTRLVQALFDDRVGEGSLNPDIAIYTDMARGAEPLPVSLATQLIATGTRAILVIDNCPPDLHRGLTELCTREVSALSLLTVEYDIVDDEPEGTDVYKLETSSPELIEHLVCEQFRNLSKVDVRTIAEFAGGNARIALILARTVDKGETLAGLTDEQLFRRLFIQRRQNDEGLYLIAQACSLVYSFQGEELADNGELGRLGRLIEKTPLEVYRGVAELRRRDLLQQRSVWRAVLPHALANRLAGVALRNVPYELIEAQLMHGDERLFRSFSKRIGYLHASDEAVAIVKRWVEADGLLADVANLTESDRVLFRNVAPAAPAEVLKALERAFGKSDLDTRKHGEPYLDLIRSLAFDAALFGRCTRLMVSILAATQVSEQSHGTRLFVSLFHLHLSGTHAPIEQRLGVITQLLESTHDRERALGAFALRAALQSTHFVSTENFDFGAHSRDFGYQPSTLEDVHHWFSAVLKVVTLAAEPSHPSAAQARTALAQSFRELWETTYVIDELDEACRHIAVGRHWPEGWLALRRTLLFDGKTMLADFRDRLIALEAVLRPRDLEQRVRSVVFSTAWGTDFDDYDDSEASSPHEAWKRAELVARDLGEAVSVDEVLLNKLLPDIVSSDGRLWQFGMGLLEGAADARTMWQRLTEAMAATEPEQRNVQVLRGFLDALQSKDPGLVRQLLDVAVNHPTHAPYYPYLQSEIWMGEEDLTRLRYSLALGKSPARAYGLLAYGQASDAINSADLRGIILSLASMPNGYEVALELLYRRFRRNGDKELDPELISTGQELLRQLAFSTRDDTDDYHLGKIVQACLIGEQGRIVAQEICTKLKDAVAKHMTYAFHHNHLLEGLFRKQPITCLDALCGGSEEELERGMWILQSVRSRKATIGQIPEEDLIRWCDGQPGNRYPAAARIVPIADKSGDQGLLHWTSLALRLLQGAPDPVAVLQQFVNQFTPHTGWSGSLAAILEAHAPLLDQLDGFEGLGSALVEAKERLRAEIEHRQLRELNRSRERDERFE